MYNTSLPMGLPPNPQAQSLWQMGGPQGFTQYQQPQRVPMPAQQPIQNSERTSYNQPSAGMTAMNDLMKVYKDAKMGQNALQGSQGLVTQGANALGYPGPSQVGGYANWLQNLWGGTLGNTMEGGPLASAGGTTPDFFSAGMTGDLLGTAAVPESGLSAIAGGAGEGAFTGASLAGAAAPEALGLADAGMAAAGGLGAGLGTAAGVDAAALGAAGAGAGIGAGVAAGLTTEELLGTLALGLFLL